VCHKSWSDLGEVLQLEEGDVAGLGRLPEGGVQLAVQQRPAAGVGRQGWGAPLGSDGS
jgi:hypothetical protein